MAPARQRRCHSRAAQATTVAAATLFLGLQRGLALADIGQAPAPHEAVNRRPLLLSAVGIAALPGPAKAWGPFGDDLPAPPDVAAVPADAEVTASGLAFKVLEVPSCEPQDCIAERPLKFDKVTVDYTGWQTNGRMFDSSVKRRQTSTFGVSQVIGGWTEGLQLMSPGEKRRFWVPAALAYGENPGGGRPGGALVFDVKLYSVERGIRPPPTPVDVAAAPADASVSASGLAWKVLTPGIGKRRPQAGSTVSVDYTGWTAGGRLFDSSILQGRPITFALSEVIQGWSEGVQLMVEGEARRFWVPAALAYGEKPADGAPGGMLVFDVKLYRILS